MKTPDSSAYNLIGGNAGFSAASLQKLGAIASLLMAVALVVAHWIYLTGKLEEPAGPLVYALADILYGPVFGAGLVAAVYALRERAGDRAPRLMTFALLLALAAACAFIAVAAVRSSNRHYHLSHPELNMQSSTMLLAVWGTLVAGIIGTAFHFLGWAFLMIGVAGWTTRRLPRVLSGLYALGGLTAMLVFLLPRTEETALLFCLVISISQGIYLWLTAPQDASSPEIDTRAIH